MVLLHQLLVKLIFISYVLLHFFELFLVVGFDDADFVVDFCFEVHDLAVLLLFDCSEACLHFFDLLILKVDVLHVKVEDVRDLADH